MATTKIAEPGAVLSATKALHERWVFERRARVLAALLAERIPEGASVLDVGCGNGVIAHLITELKPSVRFRGLEVTARPSCLIECDVFDGSKLPLADNSVDLCMFVDVLHHTHTLNIEGLLREARRVARRGVLIKDHLCENRFHHAVLAFMDWVGNRAHGVRLPYNYQSRDAWAGHFAAAGLRMARWTERVPLYPPPFSVIFGRGLHFVGQLERL